MSISRIGNLRDRIRLLFNPEKKSYSRLYLLLGFYPHDLSLYKQAFQHKSLQNKHLHHKIPNNERLEFLGDAILDAIVADIVYKAFPEKHEGFLTNTRSKIVQRETLNVIAAKIGLDDQVKYANQTFSHNNYLGGNAFEALIGAIYLDRGYRACKYFITHKILGTHINLQNISRKEVNFKSRLIEWAQKQHYLLAFNLISEGIDHDNNPIFESEVIIESIKISVGKGYSKKESHQRASKEALRLLKTEPTLARTIESAYQTRLRAAASEGQTATAPAPATTED